MSVALSSAVDWLLESDEPGIVAQAKRDLLDEQAPAEAAHVLDGPKVRALLSGQQADGGFGVGVYAKWSGAHWRLVSLVELGVPAGEPRCLAAVETILTWLTGGIFQIYWNWVFVKDGNDHFEAHLRVEEPLVAAMG